jgi:hypothetical protein
MKVINNNDGTFSIIKEVRLTQEDVETLARIVVRGYWEFRDGNSDFCREGINRESVCLFLLENGLLDNGDGMAWHTTYYPTELGKDLLMTIKN